MMTILIRGVWMIAMRNTYNMKKVIRLTESDLTRLVKRVIKEDEDVEHNFSVYDDIESELMEIPNDEVIDYLKGIIKHCEKLIEKLGDIEDDEY